MSLEEMEEAWTDQSTPRSHHINVVHRTAKFKRNFVPGFIVCFLALLVIVSGGSLKILSIQIDPNNFDKFVWSLAFDSMFIVFFLYLIRQRLRWQQELRTLGQDTCRCIEFLIRRVKEDIRAVRLEGPLILLTAFIFIVFGKWSSVGYAPLPIEEYYSVGLIACVYTLMWVHQHYRVRLYLRPRFIELKNLLQEFSAET